VRRTRKVGSRLEVAEKYLKNPPRHTPVGSGEKESFRAAVSYNSETKHFAKTGQMCYGRVSVFSLGTHLLKITLNIKIQTKTITSNTSVTSKYQAFL